MNNGRPITKNISSIIKDAFKLNSSYGVVAFVLFPVPNNDNRWEDYLIRINDKTQLGITATQHCEILEMDIDETNKCSLVVCAFKSKRFTNW